MIETPTQRLSEMIAAGESATQEFKSTLRWDILKENKSDDITYACIKTITALLNSEGGRLLIGVADDGQIVGIEKDDFSNNDKFKLHLYTKLASMSGFAAFRKSNKSFMAMAAMLGSRPCLAVDART